MKVSTRVNSVPAILGHNTNEGSMVATHVHDREKGEKVRADLEGHLALLVFNKPLGEATTREKQAVR